MPGHQSEQKRAPGVEQDKQIGEGAATRADLRNYHF
jgi:hypothetical protein